MQNTPYSNRSSEFPGDLQLWMRDNAEDNSERLARLRRNLRKAREAELTPRQQQIVTLVFDQELTLSQAARELGLNPSTVSRTLERAKQRLYRSLRYAL